MELIVAVDKNWGIGKGNDLLCHIPGDLKHVKELTMGHTLILGKKTLESLPGGNPLPGRRHIVLSFPDEVIDKPVTAVHSVEEALDAAKDDEHVFVFGGESIYRAFLPYVDKAYITKIDHAFQADRFFPNLDEDDDFTPVSVGETLSGGGYNYSYWIYERVNKEK